MCAVLMAGDVAGCGSASSDSKNPGTISSEGGKRVAKDGADMQTDDKSMPRTVLNAVTATASVRSVWLNLCE